MKSIETEGNTPQEAIDKALKILGATRQDVEIAILCEEEKGLFGLKGSKLAKVRVSLNKRVDKRKKTS